MMRSVVLRKQYILLPILLKASQCRFMESTGLLLHKWSRQGTRSDVGENGTFLQHNKEGMSQRCCGGVVKSSGVLDSQVWFWFQLFCCFLKKIAFLFCRFLNRNCLPPPRCINGYQQHMTNCRG